MPAPSTLFALGAVFVASLTIGVIQGKQPFYYDSGEYWALSEAFTVDGRFSLYGISEATNLRGYALPLVYFLVREPLEVLTTNVSLIVVAFNSAVLALIGTVLAPALARLSWPEQEWGAVRRLAVGALLLIFWGGYVNYPLSDFPALAAAMLALLAVARSTSPAWMLVAGFSAGFALNARPAYLLLTPLLLMILAWEWWRSSKAGDTEVARRLLCLGLLIVGQIAIAIPQSLIQHHDSGTYSPVPGGDHLASLQYTTGLQRQRYETYVGSDGVATTPQMEYRDPHTRDLLASLDDEWVSGTSHYIEIVVSNPVTMTGVFLRHVVNGLDQRYPTPYVSDLDPSRPLRIGGFLIVFLALLRICWPAARASLGRARWRFPLALALSASTSVASGVETRFMLPIFVLCLILVAAPRWPFPLGPAELGIRRYRVLAVSALAAIAYFALVWTIVTGASDNLVLV